MDWSAVFEGSLAVYTESTKCQVINQPSGCLGSWVDIEDSKLEPHRAGNS